jgi:Tol biopolymer transport system component
MNADGSGVTPLTTSNDREPTWSRDGSRFAAARLGTTCGLRGCAPPPRIIVGNSDGSSVVLLSSGTYPAWSPDGRIAFSSANDIYVMNGDGSGLTKLTTDPSADLQPAWSPDGKKIAFLSNRGGIYDLYVMNPDGTGVTAVTADSATEGRATWSPDGKRIAFESNRGGIYEVYVMNADGSGVVRVTNGHDVQPAWAP